MPSATYKPSSITNVLILSLADNCYVFFKSYSVQGICLENSVQQKEIKETESVY